MTRDAKLLAVLAVLVVAAITGVVVCAVRADQLAHARDQVHDLQRQLDRQGVALGECRLAFTECMAAHR